MGKVTAGQVALLVASVALFAAGWAVSLLRLWVDGGNDTKRTDRDATLRLASKACVYGGILVGLGVLVWHSAYRGSWLPVEDNFDAFTWLGLLLALFILYMQRAHPLRGLDWFLLPVVVLLLIAAAVFGSAQPHEYNVKNIWLWVHRVSAYGGALAFAVAFAVGAMFLIVHGRLRAKRAMPAPSLGSLERLEHLTLVSVTLGLSLLTIGAVTGFVRWAEMGQRTPLAKIVLTSVVWVVYAAVLHSPINPSFRGRKAAVLSVVGFCLMVGTIVAVQFM